FAHFAKLFAVMPAPLRLYFYLSEHACATPGRRELSCGTHSSIFCAALYTRQLPQRSDVSHQERGLSLLVLSLSPVLQSRAAVRSLFFFRHLLFPHRNILIEKLVFISERTHTLFCPHDSGRTH